jgi:hypothetical protein
MSSCLSFNCCSSKEHRIVYEPLEKDWTDTKERQYLSDGEEKILWQRKYRFTCRDCIMNVVFYLYRSGDYGSYWLKDSANYLHYPEDLLKRAYPCRPRRKPSQTGPSLIIPNSSSVRIIISSSNT